MPEYDFVIEISGTIVAQNEVEARMILRAVLKVQGGGKLDI